MATKRGRRVRYCMEVLEGRWMATVGRMEPFLKLDLDKGVADTTSQVFVAEATPQDPGGEVIVFTRDAKSSGL